MCGTIPGEPMPESKNLELRSCLDTLKKNIQKIRNQEDLVLQKIKEAKDCLEDLMFELNDFVNIYEDKIYYYKDRLEEIEESSKKKLY